MTAFRTALAVLLFIILLCRTVCPSIVDFPDYITDVGIYLLICQDFLRRVYEQDIQAGFHTKSTLEPSPALPDAPLEQIALYCPFEKFFRNRNQDAVVVFSGIVQTDIAQLSCMAVSAPGKKSFYAFLAAQSFVFRKGICDFCVHFISATEMFQELLLLKGFPG